MQPTYKKLLKNLQIHHRNKEINKQMNNAKNSSNRHPKNWSGKTTRRKPCGENKVKEEHYKDGK